MGALACSCQLTCFRRQCQAGSLEDRSQERKCLLYSCSVSGLMFSAAQAFSHRFFNRLLGRNYYPYFIDGEIEIQWHQSNHLEPHSQRAVDSVFTPHMSDSTVHALKGTTQFSTSSPEARGALQFQVISLRVGTSCFHLCAISIWHTT